MEVKWNPPEDSGGTSILNYLIEMREMTHTRWRQVAVVDASTTRYTLKNLLDGQDYMVRVKARNREGEGLPLISEVVPAPQVHSEYHSRYFSILSFFGVIFLGTTQPY